MLVITDDKNIVREIAMIPGTNLNIPHGWHAYFPVTEKLPKNGEAFIPDIKLQPWLAVAAALVAEPSESARHLAEDDQVVVRISGRTYSLKTNWSLARDRFVIHFGIIGIKGCRAALESGKKWKGYADPGRHQWLEVERVEPNV